jgi:hypothetical protein
MSVGHRVKPAHPVRLCREPRPNPITAWSRVHPWVAESSLPLCLGMRRERREGTSTSRYCDWTIKYQKFGSQQKFQYLEEKESRPTQTRHRTQENNLYPRSLIRNLIGISNPKILDLRVSDHP